MNISLRLITPNFYIFKN